MRPAQTCSAWLALALTFAQAAEFRVPGVNYQAQVRQEVSILPGGVVLRPFGARIPVGPRPVALAVRPGGKTIVTANLGAFSRDPNVPSLTVVSRKKEEPWNLDNLFPEPGRSTAWQFVAGPIALAGDGIWVSEGATGRVTLVNQSTGKRRQSIDLNSSQYRDSHAGPLFLDPKRELLFILDKANQRVAIADIKKAAVIASAPTGFSPAALALSEDGQRLFAAGPSLSILDVSNPVAARMTAEIPLSPADPHDSGRPANLLVHGKDVYISLADEDLIRIVDSTESKVTGEIPLQMKGLEAMRGIRPMGLAWESRSNRLLVAESGINAVGVIDPESRKVLGHIPAGWEPSCIHVEDGKIIVLNTRGFGVGPSDPFPRAFSFHAPRREGHSEQPGWYEEHGSLSLFELPDDKELERQTGLMVLSNGFDGGAFPRPTNPVPPIRYVVLITRGNHSFDEELGDLRMPPYQVVMGAADYARYGLQGYVPGGKTAFSLRVPVTPNLHRIAAQWSFSDNYYAPDRPADRLVARSQFWARLVEQKIAFRDFAQDLAIEVPDHARATFFLDALRQDYLEKVQPLPRLLYLDLPHDRSGDSHPPPEYPYAASYIAENDYALARVMEFLSHSPWWPQMVVFVAGTGGDAGPDHIDASRTTLLAAGPWVRTGYVSHTNATFTSLQRTIFRIFGISPTSLGDATAADLSDLFANVPDFQKFAAQAEDERLFVPEQ